MVFNVKDYITDGIADSEGIRACLADRKKTDEKCEIVFSGKDYYIDEAIQLPSDTTVIIDGCKIIHNNYVFDNIFRGDNYVIDPENPYGFPLDVKTIKNISITGKNGAEIMGAEKSKRGFHCVMNEEQDMVGDFWGWRAQLISLCRCDGFEISGITLSRTKNWAMSFDFCCNGFIHDVTINSNVKNGDGIDFRAGCHHCRVDGVHGFTSDDTVACTALGDNTMPVYPDGNYLYPNEPTKKMSSEQGWNRDIHDIEIKNVLTGGHHHGVICLTSCERQLYNIHIENVKESGVGSRQAAVKIYTGYGKSSATGAIHDITVDTVEANISDYAVLCEVEAVNVEFKNIVQTNPEKICIRKKD